MKIAVWRCLGCDETEMSEEGAEFHCETNKHKVEKVKTVTA